MYRLFVPMKVWECVASHGFLASWIYPIHLCRTNLESLDWSLTLGRPLFICSHILLSISQYKRLNAVGQKKRSLSFIGYRLRQREKVEGKSPKCSTFKQLSRGQILSLTPGQAELFCQRTFIITWRSMQKPRTLTKDAALQSGHCAQS
jgi:hypothetical protein